MSEDDPYAAVTPVQALVVRSDDLKHGEEMPLIFRDPQIGGANTSPHLAWSDFPAQTRSFALTCYDPDAPTGSGFWHWIVIDIPGSVTSLPAGAGTVDGAGLPAGAFQVRNDYGTKDFGGAAPPAGDDPHRYVFAVHALDVETLGIDSDVTPAVAGFNLRFHTIARALVIPVFGH